VGSISVKRGDKVTAGQVIGISGDGKDKAAAGNAFGLDPQVHFEVRGGNGLPHKNGGTIFNPHDYLPRTNPHD
jgi:murein DD-endopeptidase MepM/ murein hydrolase activator NlpD